MRTLRRLSSMKKHRIPFAFGLILLCALSILCPAHAGNENPSLEIEKKILELEGIL